MKKVLFSILASVSVAAGAVEVGVTGSNTQTDNRYGYGVTVGQNVAGVNLTAGFSQYTRESNDQNRFTLTAGKELFKAGTIGISARGGVGYLDNQTTASGYVATVGVGASVPVTKSVSFDVVIDRQYGQSRVDAYNGNIVTAGLKYGF